MVLESVLVSFFYKWLTSFPSTVSGLFKTKIRLHCYSALNLAHRIKTKCVLFPSSSCLIWPLPTSQVLLHAPQLLITFPFLQFLKGILFFLAVPFHLFSPT